MADKIRFINLDDFISMVEDGTFIYLQANKEDVINAAKSMAVYEKGKADRPQGEFDTDELCRLRSDLKSGLVVGSTLRDKHQVDRYIKALDDVIDADMRGGV